MSYQSRVKKKIQFLLFLLYSAYNDTFLMKYSIHFMLD